MKRFLAAIAAFLGLPAQAEAPRAPSGPMSVQGFHDALQGAAEAELDLAGFLELQRNGKVIVLDVRSPQSFADLHIEGAINAPLTGLTEKTLPQILPDKDVPVALMCEHTMGMTRMISMTIQAYPVLKANGYKHIYRLTFWKDAKGKMVPYSEIEKAVKLVGPRTTR